MRIHLAARPRLLTSATSATFATFALLVAASPLLADQGGAAFFEGQLHFDEGRIREAGGAFARAGNLGYDPIPVNFWMGRCYLLTGSPGRAAKHLQRALDGGMQDATLHAGLARALIETGKAAEALPHLARAETLEKGRTDVALMRGRLATEAHDYEAAYLALRNAVHDFPDEVKDLARAMPMVHEKALVELADLRMVALEAEAAAEAAAPPAAPVVEPPEDPGSISKGLTSPPIAAGTPGSSWASTPKASSKAGKSTYIIKRRNWGGTQVGSGS